MTTAESPHNPIRVLVADDHALVREGLCRVVDGLPRIEVVAQAASGQEALEQVAVTPVDVALLDYAMPQMNGLETMRRLRRLASPPQCVIVSMYSNEEYVLQALQDGACGFLLKDAGVKELEVAVMAAANGQSFLCPSVSRHVIAEYLNCMEGSGRVSEPLTERQREVLMHVAEGMSSKAIAAHLGLSVKTVEDHRAELMTRLGVRNTAGLITEAVRVGLLAPG